LHYPRDQIVPGGVKTPSQARWSTPEGKDKIVAAQCLNEPIQPARGYSVDAGRG
jgi:hypothetical protein